MYMEISNVKRLKVEVELTAKQIDRKIYKVIAEALEEMQQQINRKHIQKRKKQIKELLNNFSDNLDILVNSMDFDASRVVQEPKDLRDIEVIKGCQKAIKKLLIASKENPPSVPKANRNSIQAEEVQIMGRSIELIAILHDIDHYMEGIKKYKKDCTKVK